MRRHWVVATLHNSPYVHISGYPLYINDKLFKVIQLSSARNVEHIF